MFRLKFFSAPRKGAAIEKDALKYGLTLSTARWIEELAKELGIKEKKLFKTIVKLAKHGIWLEAEDWRLMARHIDLSRHLDMATDYIIRRVAAGVPPAKAVKEIPNAVYNVRTLFHIRDVLSNLF
jgi:biotin operon repressor